MVEKQLSQLNQWRLPFRLSAQPLRNSVRVGWLRCKILPTSYIQPSVFWLFAVKTPTHFIALCDDDTEVDSSKNDPVCITNVDDQVMEGLIDSILDGRERDSCPVLSSITHDAPVECEPSTKIITSAGFVVVAFMFFTSDFEWSFVRLYRQQLLRSNICPDLQEG